MSGGAPISIHQQALRGIALVALERGDTSGAMAQVSAPLPSCIATAAVTACWRRGNAALLPMPPASRLLLQYERILGKAALGRGPTEHWAHADYGHLLYKQGDLQASARSISLPSINAIGLSRARCDRQRCCRRLPAGGSAAPGAGYQCGYVAWLLGHRFPGW